MLIEEALKHVGESEAADDAFTRLFGDQMTPEAFREHLFAVRQIPEELLPKLAECRTKFPEEAYRHCFPDAVSRDEFRRAVSTMRAEAKSAEAAEVAVDAEVAAEETQVEAIEVAEEIAVEADKAVEETAG